MKAYIVELDHWSNQKVINVVLASSPDEAKAKTLRNHGSESKVTYIREVTETGTIILCTMKEGLKAI